MPHSKKSFFYGTKYTQMCFASILMVIVLEEGLNCRPVVNLGYDGIVESNYFTKQKKKKKSSSDIFSFKNPVGTGITIVITNRFKVASSVVLSSRSLAL